MIDPTSLGEDAARLIAFGLRPKLRPARDAEYAGLLRRYRDEGALRQMVAVITRGLGLVVLGDTEHGLSLGAQDDSPFSLKLADYRRSGLSVDERLAHGLIQLAIAAWCFPTPRSLEDPDNVVGPQLSTRRLVEYLVELCQELSEAHDEDPELGAETLREAWRVILSRAETRQRSDHRRSASTLMGMVAHALERLEAGGLLRKLSDKDHGTWQALGTFRLQVRELAAHELLALVQRAAQKASREAESS